jgi:enediyne biosynthesis protein E4
VIAEDYPLPANSRILRNDSRDGKVRFTDVTKEIAPELLGTGLVTSALWTDADGDGALDLLVAHEWGPVKLFLNRGGKLVLRKANDDLARKLGWWNGLAGADVDHDGDMDYVATNLGRNTRYRQPDEQHPIRIYYGQFFDGGLPKIVEAHYEGDRLVPMRGLNVCAMAMPELKEKFRTHRAYAGATIKEIYTAKSLEAAQAFEANTCESGVFINDGPNAAGEPAFHFKPLPLPAQFSPGFGVICNDLDGDGNADIYLVENQRATYPELAPFDGGVSQLLLGDGHGEFTPVEPRRSGLIEPGDAKACTLADLNVDDWPDLAISVNNQALDAFIHRGIGDRGMLRVELPTGAAGARVTVRVGELPPQTAELAIGGGYASQGPPLLWFGLGSSKSAGEIAVRWPDGKLTHQAFSGTRVRMMAPQ